ncbi:hypothetical protein Trydic_g542 [Trypoxylus dichotomus]
MAFINVKRRDGTHTSCSGAALTPEWILTTAFCIWNVSPNKVKVHIGITDIKRKNEDRAVQTMRASKVFRHDDFCFYTVCNYTHMGYDIGLILLQNPFRETDECKVGKLPDNEIKYRKARVIAIGFMPTKLWNLTLLQEMETNVFDANDEDKCRTVERDPICIFEPSVDIIIGNSGSPLIHEGLVIGIASHALVDGTGTVHMVYENTYAYKNWITNKMQKDTDYEKSIGNSTATNLRLQLHSSLSLPILPIVFDLFHFLRVL